MRRGAGALLTLLAGAGALAAPADPARSVTLSVTFDLQTRLLNREAPHRLEFSTPWGKAVGGVVGEAHPDKRHPDAFGTVRPLRLRVPVPPSARPGAYAARLTGELYLCDAAQTMCLRHELDLPLKVQVLASGHVRPPAPVTLNDATLAPPWRWRP